MRLLVAAFWLLLAAAPARAYDSRAVSCGCYCGKSLPPPCSDYACQQACGYGGGGGDPNFQLARPGAGNWTRHFGRKFKEHQRERCGANPICTLANLTVTGVLLPVGLVLDAPVWTVKGLYYGGRGLGRAIAYPFRKRPKPYKYVAPPPPPPPPVAGPEACAQALADSRSGALSGESEDPPKSSFELGMQFAANEGDLLWPPEGAPGTFNLERDKFGMMQRRSLLISKKDVTNPKAPMKDLAGEVQRLRTLDLLDKGMKAHAFKKLLLDMSACLAAPDTAGSGKCVAAAEKAMDQFISKVGGKIAARIQLARDVYKSLTAKYLAKAEKAMNDARCLGQ